MAANSSTHVHRVETVRIVRRDLPSVSLIEICLTGPDGMHTISAFGDPDAPEVDILRPAEEDA